LVGYFNQIPVRVDPAPESSEWLFERSAEFGELIEGSGLDALGIEVAANQPVSLGASQRVSEDLVRDPLQRVVKVLVATPSLSQLGERCQSPPSPDRVDEPLR
jgi:hypothetical protein